MAETESTFDAATFLNEEIAGEMETRYTPIPADTYNAMIDDIAVREVTDAVLLDVTYKLLDVASLEETMGMDRLTVRQGLFLDIGANGAIAIGPNKNVKLGRLRDAVGQNKAGKWNFAMLKGAGPLKIAVSVKPDKDDPTIVYNRVDKTMAV